MSVLKINEAHQLVGKVTQLDCPKNTKKFKELTSIVLHYTAGRDALSSAAYLCKDNIKASAHLVIGRKGEIFQLVPFDTVAWHAGQSSYQGKNGYNDFSIGIEIDNAGPLEAVGQSYTAWFGKKYPATAVIRAKHRNEDKDCFWHTYTEKQIEAVEQICEVLMQNYPSIYEILGHEEISPNRKRDPGPAFPLDKIRDRLIENREVNKALENTNAAVNVPFLNIRQFPNMEAPKVMNPLEEGTQLEILQERDGWLKVRTEIEGWVAAEYVAFRDKI